MKPRINLKLNLDTAKVMVICGVMCSISFYFKNFLIANEEKIFELVVMAFWMILAFTPFMLLVNQTNNMVKFLNWSKDLIRLRRWLQEKNLMTGAEFLELISQYKSNSARIRFVNTCREQGLLDANKTSEVLLESLILAVECHQKAYQIDTLVERQDAEDINATQNIKSTLSKLSFKSELFQKWHTEYIENYNCYDGKYLHTPIVFFMKFSNYFNQTPLGMRNYPLKEWENPLLDDLVILFEQVRNRNRKSQ